MNSRRLAVGNAVYSRSILIGSLPWVAWVTLLLCFLGTLTSAFLFFSGAARGAETATLPPPIAASASEPIRYVGKEQPDKRFYDGALRHAVGVHR